MITEKFYEMFVKELGSLTKLRLLINVDNDECNTSIYRCIVFICGSEGGRFLKLVEHGGLGGTPGAGLHDRDYRFRWILVPEWAKKRHL